MITEFASRVEVGWSSIAELKDEGLINLVVDYFSSKRYNRYQDPEVVANMLQYRFEMRRDGQLAFSEDLIPQVTDAFERQQKRIEQDGQELIQQTIAKVKLAYETAGK